MSSRQDLTTTGNAGTEELGLVVEIRFILDATTRDVLRSKSNELPDLQDISNEYYCNIYIYDSAMVVNWKTCRPPPKSLVNKVAARVQAFIQKTVEHDQLLLPRFSATVMYPEILDVRFQASLVEYGNPRVVDNGIGWHLVEVGGTRTQVTEYLEHVYRAVAQYSDEKLVVDKGQYKFLFALSQCRSNFLTSLLAPVNTVTLQMKEHRYIRLNGRKDEVETVAEHIRQALSKMVIEVLQFPMTVVNWLENVRNLNSIQLLLTERNIGAALEVKDGTLRAYSDSSSTIQAVVDILKREIISQPLTKMLDESRELLSSHDHKDELSRILNDCADLVLEDQTWKLVGWHKDISMITQKLDDFFNKYTVVKRKVLCSEAHVAYICHYCKAELENVKADVVKQSALMKLNITDDFNGFLLKGSAVQVEFGTQMLLQLIGKVQSHLLPIDNVPKIKELLEGRISEIEKQSETIIRVPDRGSLDLSAIRQCLPGQPPNSSDVTCRELTGQVVSAKPTEDRLILPVQVELCNIQADILVNSVHWSLDLGRGAIARSVSQSAGSQLQEELHSKYPEGLEFFQQAISNSHNIGCVAIIHVVCAPYCGKYTEDNLRMLFLACLKEADRRKAASIAFPAIGTGLYLHYPPDTVFTLLHDAVAIFRKDRVKSSLKKVYCSLTDPTHFEVFQECSKKSLNRDRQLWNPSQAKAPDTSVLSIAIDQSSVQVMQMIPTREWHVIIRFDGTKKSQSTGTAVSSYQPGTVYISKDADSSQFTAAVVAAIRRSESLKATSLSIVPNNSGTSLNEKTAKCVAEAIHKYYEKDGGAITEISVIVAYDPRCSYCQSLLTVFYQPEYPLQKKSIFGSFSLKLPWNPLSYFKKSKDVMASTSCETSDDDLVIVIYGISVTQIQAAKDRLQCLLSQECFLEVLPFRPEDIAILDAKQISSLVELGPMCDTRIIVLEDQRKIVIKGISKEQINRAREMIKDFFSAAQKEWYESQMKRQQLERAKSLLKSVQWQYQDSDIWINLEEVTNMAIEDSYAEATSRSQSDLTSIGKLYYDPRSSPNVIFTGHDAGKNHCPLRRIDVQAWKEFPDTWDYCEEYCERPVPRGSEEFFRIESEFINDAGASASEVIEITRIQDPYTWRQFKIQERRAKSLMTNGAEHCTRHLWHGTSSETAFAILRDHRFNRSFAGNDVLYGRGAYFARDASYAAQPQYAKPSGGIRTVILADVITGCFTRGHPSMTIPPNRPGSTYLTYDSTVDDERDPSIFVVYHDSQAYPLYVIKFK